jgi:Asp-tRNA(Asn)/Glu-tRNA(Gln) amidotransferase A subunit family amidase
MSIRALGAEFRSCRLSPVEMVEALLAAIEADGGRVNAFALIDRDAALAAARAAEARFRDGRPLGALDGVPVSIKDLTNVAGWPTRRGAAASAGEPPATADAPAVAALRAAGAVIFGKTTTAEYGWAPISDCPHTGRTLNPVSPAHTAGGSSAGAAAQIAAGWGPLALGSDAGGSIRIPASYCGLVGFKPSYGAIPQAPLSAFGDFSHLGPLTRSLDDCEEAMAVLARPDRRDQSSLYPRTGTAPLGRPRVGLCLRLGTERAGVVPEVEAAVRGVADGLADAGYAVSEVALDGIEPAEALWVSWRARLLESFVGWPAERLALLSPLLQRLVEEGRALEPAAIGRAQQTLRDTVARLSALFLDVDILLTPATPDGAFLAGDLAPRSHPAFAEIAASGNWFLANSFAFPFNLSGQPALVLPRGTTADGRPFGVQLVGRKYDDAAVLALGRAVEELAPGR